LTDRIGGPANRRRARLCVLLLGCTALAGCETRGGNIPYDPPGFSAPPTASVAAFDAYDVKLGPLDVLRINVFRVPDLSGEYQIDGYGNVDLPLVGSIKARDMSAEEFGKQLEQLYGAQYLNSPEINVRVMTTNQLNVTVEGAVNSPGVFPLPGKTTLLGVIAMARGPILLESNPKRVAIFRKREGQTQAAAFDLVAIRKGEMADPVVYPGDIVVVQGASVRAIYRELLQTIPMIAVFSNL
jgi:polysaccharide export outer membrane protein